MQLPDSPAVSFCDHATVKATELGRCGLHRQPQPGRQPRGVLVPGDVEHMHIRQVEQGIDAPAVATRLSATRRRLSHRRGLSAGCLVATDPEGPRPIHASATRTRATHPPRTPKSRIASLRGIEQPRAELVGRGVEVGAVEDVGGWSQVRMAG
jgi:hypothetical protein